MSETVPPPWPSPEEIDRFHKLRKEDDPTQSSLLNPEGKMEQVGTVVTRGHRAHDVYKHEDDTYYKIEDGAAQQLIARLLKGIINVSDIVTREGESGLEFFSRQMPLDKVKERISKDEVLADNTLLKVILNDIDRAQLKDGSYHNAQQKDSKVSFYDFGESRFSEKNLVEIEDEKRYLDGLYRRFSPEALARYEEKLKFLKERFLNEEGKEFFMRLYKDASEKDPDRDRRQGYGLFYLPKEQEANQVYAILGGRIRHALESIDLIIQERTPETS